MQSHSKISIYGALIANTGIAIIKFLAALLGIIIAFAGVFLSHYL